MARIATDGAAGVIRTTVLLTEEHKKMLKAIGGSATVRRLIEAEHQRALDAGEIKRQRKR